MRLVLGTLCTSLAFPAYAQGNAPTASEIVARIRQGAGVQVRAATVDRFIAGDPETRVKGIAVTMMATFDVLKRAVANGDNFIITHEPTFYSSRDTVAVLEQENDALLAVKQKFIRDNGLVIWRFHDTPHAMHPDMITAGIIRALGWEKYKADSSSLVYDLPPSTLKQLAATIGPKLHATAIRISGDPKARVSRVVITEGFPGFAANRHALQHSRADVLVMGEDLEWETIEYAVDAISAGRLKGLIVLGHIPSEQAGMEEFARWLTPLVPEVPVHVILTRDPFRTDWR